MPNDVVVSQVESWVQAYANEPGGLLPLLHTIQDEYGYIPEISLPLIAKGLCLSEAEVHGVITFYDRFSTTPPTEHTVHICQAEACQAVGARALTERVKQVCEGQDQTSIRDVYCLGFCACGPAMVINGLAHAQVDLDTVEALLRDAGAVT